MTIAEWLARRTPQPPDALRTRLESVLASVSTPSAANACDACLDAAERLMTDVLRGDCTSRESALDLLTADALVTYAFEAAADAPAELATRASVAIERIASLDAARRGAMA